MAWLITLLVVAGVFGENRAWAFLAPSEPAPGQIALATPTATGEKFTACQYDAPDCRLAARGGTMFSRTAGAGMDASELSRIRTAFERAGHSMDIGSTEGVRRLDYFGVEASTLGDVITLRPNPSRSAVFEELIHSAQNRLGRNDGSPLSRVLNEIEAQEKLIRFRREYGIPRAETQQTIQALRDYRTQLQLLQGN